MSRCLALAERLRAPVVFFLDPDGTWTAGLERSGLEWRVERDHRGAERLLAKLAAGALGATLFDGYELDEDTISRAAKHGFCVEIDERDRPPLGHARLSPGFADASHAKAQLAGVEFALLGSAFAQAHDTALAAPPPAGVTRNVLVAMGARDSINATSLALAALQEAKFEGNIVVALPRTAVHFDSVMKIANTLPNVRVEAEIDDMTALYGAAGLALGAGGTSLLERLCCGLPGVSLVLAENQAHAAAAAAEAGAAIDAGPVGGLDAAALADLLRPLLQDGARRARLRQAGLALVDGRGAERAAERLEALRENFA